MKNKLLLTCLVISGPAFSGAFVFSGEGNGANAIAHPISYTGTGGVINLSVCIDPTSTVTTGIIPSVQNTIATWNNLSAVSPNLVNGTNNNIGSNQIDWESVVLHEVGHCIGLAHPNLGSRTGVSGPNTNFTQSTDGTSDSFVFDAGIDTIIGSNDDIRGDNINLHWFNKNINNPYIASPPYDASNYSVLLADLPVTDNYPANAGLSVGNALGFANTEAVMQQGSRFDEDQRRLSVDDEATLRLGMSGLDLVQGTADDYTIQLSYGGVTAGCDINILHHPISGLAFCSLGGSSINGGVGSHVRITSASIEVGSDFNWFFNSGNLSDFIFKDGFE